MHEIAPSLAVEGAGNERHRRCGEVAGPADAVLHARAHDVGGVHVAVDVGLDHAVHRQAAEPADHLRMVADLLRPQDDLVAVAADVAVQLGHAVLAQGEAPSPRRRQSHPGSIRSMPSWITSV